MSCKIKELFSYCIKKIHEKDLIRRAILYIAGLFILAFGVAVGINADLGVSVVNLNPFIISEIFETTMGQFVTAMLIIFILIELAILRRKFTILNVLQIIPSFMFGYFVDLSRWIVGDFRIPTLAGSVLMLLTCSLLLSSGLVIYMNAKLVSMPAEGIVEVVASVIPNGTFPKTKIMFDCTLVSIAIVISLAYFGRLHGIHVGTLFLAMNTGRIMPLVRRVIDPFLRKTGFSLDW